MQLTRIVPGLAVVAALFAITAQAAPLPPGSLVTTPTGLPTQNAPTGGVKIVDNFESAFVSQGSGAYSGKLVTNVISGDTSNPLGGLTFTYELFNDQSSTHSLNRFTVNGWDSLNLDVVSGLPAPAGAVIPAFADREASGTSIGFSFVRAPIGPGALAPGQRSTTMVVYTNANVFVPTNAYVLDGFPANMLTFAPVPEPSTMVLAGAGLALTIAGMARRSRRKVA
jgi:hypothetical protein